MILGILRETKKGENRVICTPKEVETITTAGHTVYAQRGCGERAGFSDEAYESAGALLTDSVQELFKVCDMVAKVKEFTPEEWPLIRTDPLLDDLDGDLVLSQTDGSGGAALHPCGQASYFSVACIRRQIRRRSTR